MITVSVEFKPASPSGKVKARAVIGRVGMKGQLWSKFTYVDDFWIDKALSPATPSLEVMGAAEELAHMYLQEHHISDAVNAEEIEEHDSPLFDVVVDFGYSETIMYKGAYLVLFDEAQ